MVHLEDSPEKLLAQGVKSYRNWYGHPRIYRMRSIADASHYALEVLDHDSTEQQKEYATLLLLKCAVAQVDFAWFGLSFYGKMWLRRVTTELHKQDSNSSVAERTATILDSDDRHTMARRCWKDDDEHPDFF